MENQVFEEHRRFTCAQKEARIIGRARLDVCLFFECTEGSTAAGCPSLYRQGYNIGTNSVGTSVSEKKLEIERPSQAASCSAPSSARASVRPMQCPPQSPESGRSISTPSPSWALPRRIPVTAWLTSSKALLIAAGARLRREIAAWRMRIQLRAPGQICARRVDVLYAGTDRRRCGFRGQAHRRCVAAGVLRRSLASRTGHRRL